MSLLEEVIPATLDSNGEVHLSHPSQVPPGPVLVTIRVNPANTRRSLADVIREIAAEQRARGYPGRSSRDLQAEEDALHAEDEARDQELDSARGVP